MSGVAVTQPEPTPTSTDDRELPDETGDENALADNAAWADLMGEEPLSDADDVADDSSQPADETPPSGEGDEPAPAKETPPSEPQQQEPPAAEAGQQQDSQQQQQPFDVNAYWQQRQQQLESAYTISEEEADTLQVNPEKVLPRLAARVQVAVEATVLQALQQSLPQMVGHVLTQRDTQVQQEDAFYSAHPALKEKVAADPQAKATVERMRELFAKSNPNMDEATRNAQVGAAAMIALGIPLGQPEPPSASAVAQRVPPRSPGSRQSAPPANPKQKLGQVEQVVQEMFSDDDPVVF